MTITAAPPVLARRILPKSRAASIAAVVGFAAFTALAAQISFRIPPIEVPFTGSTMAVLLTGGVLGSRRGEPSGCPSIPSRVRVLTPSSGPPVAT